MVDDAITLLSVEAEAHCRMPCTRKRLDIDRYKTAEHKCDARTRIVVTHARVRRVTARPREVAAGYYASSTARDRLDDVGNA